MLPTILAFILIGMFFIVEQRLRDGKQARSLERGGFDRGSTVGIVCSFLISVVSLLASLFLPQTVPLILRWLGIVLMVAGLGLRIWAFRTLGRYYTRTLLVTERHEVVTQEPYTYVRHPGYLAVLAMWIGAGLASGSPVTLLIVAVAMIAAYSYRIHVEEAMLISAFGEAYERYRAHTHRLIPFVY